MSATPSDCSPRRLRGPTNTQIAERLMLSPRTVDTHVASLLATTGCAARTELRGWADRAGDTKAR